MSASIPAIIELTYLSAAILFIIGLRFLNSPLTARKGNFLSSFGMLLAIVATLFHQSILRFDIILAGCIVGSLIGIASAYLVKMTAMPQMVGIQNGFGGGASTIVALGEILKLMQAGEALSQSSLVSIVLGLLIGGVTFTGSMLAFLKLQGWVTGAPITFKFQQPFNALFALLFLVGSIYVFLSPQMWVFYSLMGLAFLGGILFVLPIGGADMPVVISLLNSFSGLAAAATGFIIHNDGLIIAGALVGASGIILTQIMCKGMNRSLKNVLFEAFGTGNLSGCESTVTAESHKSIRSTDIEQVAMMLGYANSIIIVPGYGMAASQAQHAVQSLSDTLVKKGVNVKFAIHPVAGRMPGHMNVLLAEADVPYEQLYDMEAINPEFEKTDIVVVIGANDVVNPAARHDRASPIYGMPILNVDRARNIIVIKRSLNPGFSGIENELFYNEKTLMLFGNAKEVVSKLASEIQSLT